METRHKILHPYIPSAACKATYDDGTLCIEGLNREGLVVLSVSFGSILLFRLMDEGMRLKLLTELSGMRGLLMTDEDSLLTHWISDESCGTRDTSEARHFIVFAGEEILDIVSTGAPTIVVSS
jgi:hypothetical protein